ncbi:MAG TPA: germination protein YpeB [Syntrophomonadaceae bacterium]|nr:germination protein YpeB [Syntrophomonadaceae bacterium]
MKNRYTAAIITLAVLFGVTALWGMFQVKERRVAETQLENKYNRAFYESLQRSKNVEALLSKGLASGSSSNTDNLFADLWYNANAAQENLHQLPLSHQVVARTSKFLTQVGDYAYAITKRDQGTKLTERDRTTMRELYGKSQNLTKEMSAVQRQASAGTFKWTEVKKGLDSKFAKGSSGADDSFRRVDSQMQEIPVLIYDGPFSDHLDRAKPLGVTGKTVTSGQAQKSARSFIDFKGAKVSEVESTKEVKGKIPAYGFEFRTGNKPSDVITINVTKTGGHVVYYTNPRLVGKAKISVSKAKSLAEDFLQSRGIKNMMPTYTLRANNTLTVSFAYKQRDVVIYPDLIKVMVALDNGQILTYDAMGFLMSHHKRDLPKAKISIDEARKKLNPELKVKAERMAVIPTAGKHEVLAYEFKAEMRGDTFLVYINALTGGEEHIFKLLKTPGGTLVL